MNRSSKKRHKNIIIQLNPLSSLIQRKEKQKEKNGFVKASFFSIAQPQKGILSRMFETLEFSEISRRSFQANLKIKHLHPAISFLQVTTIIYRLC